MGNEETYKRDNLDGTHRPCLDAAVAMAKQSILDLLTSSPQQWICSSCRFKDDHLAMLSVEPTCACGITLEDTVGVYASMWMDGLTRRYQGKVMSLSNMTVVNFAKLAEHLVNPHFGQANGLTRPDHWAQGIEGTCACIRVPTEVKVSNVLDKTPVAICPSSQGGIAENMETNAEDDLTA